MTWPITWTRGHYEEVTAPLEKRRLLIPLRQRVKFVRGIPTLMTWKLKLIDGVPNFVGTSWVHAGPLLFIVFPAFKIWRWRIPSLKLYWGFRSSAPWPAGFGDEGVFGFVARWLKEHDMGNLAVLPTIKKA